MIALAVDAGGTSTRCVVVDHDGSCLGYGHAGPGNPISAGVELAARSVAEAVSSALAMAGVAARRVDTWLVAIAGGAADGDWEAFEEPTRAVGVRSALEVRGDALAAFSSGTWSEDGCVLIVGTGAIAIRVEDGEMTAISDGLGWLLGDDGSGFWIGHRVARAALAALEGRGPATALAPLFTTELSRLFGVVPAARFDQGRTFPAGSMLEVLYRARPVELAGFARLAFQAAGDPIADAIICEAADALTATLGSVIVGGQPGEVVLGGGILTHNPQFASRIVESLRPTVAPENVHMVPDGLAGAAVLALRAADRPVDAHLFARINSTLAALRRAQAPQTRADNHLPPSANYPASSEPEAARPPETQDICSTTGN